MSMAIGRHGESAATGTKLAISAPEPESSRIKKLEKLIKKRL